MKVKQVQMWVDPEFKQLSDKMKRQGCKGSREATRIIARVIKNMKIIIKK